MRRRDAVGFRVGLGVVALGEMDTFDWGASDQAAVDRTFLQLGTGERET